MQSNMLVFDDFAVYCLQYAKYEEKKCTICKICQTQFQYAEYALPTLLMLKALTPISRACSGSRTPLLRLPSAASES